MRLIDADKLYEKVDESQLHNNHSGLAHALHHNEHSHFKFMIHQAHTIEAEIVRHGLWIIVDDCEKFIAKCSECGRLEDSRCFEDYLYCHCGAKMDLRTPTEAALDMVDSVMMGDDENV